MANSEIGTDWSINDPMLDPLPTDAAGNVTNETIAQAVNTTYKFSMRKVCRIFRASRQWVHDNIRPHARHIRIPRRMCGPSLAENLPRLPADHDCEPKLDFSHVWFNHDDILRLLEDYGTAYVRTRQVCWGNHVSDPQAFEQVVLAAEAKAHAYSDRDEERGEEAWSEGRISSFVRGYAIDYLREHDPELASAISHPISAQQRSHVEWAEHALTTDELRLFVRNERFRVASDLKEWGDTDEEVHRRLFETAALKFELALPDIQYQKPTKPRALYVPGYGTEKRSKLKGRANAYWSVMPWGNSDDDA